MIPTASMSRTKLSPMKKNRCWRYIRAKRLHADDAQDKRQGQGKGGTQARVEHALGVPVSDEMVAGEQDVRAPARRGP